MTRIHRFAVLLSVCAWLGAARPSEGVAQPAPPASAQTGPAQQQQAVVSPLGVSPRGALIRAMLVPGWGHAAIGSYSRGGFYFGLEALTAYTFLRTRGRLNDARERAALRESVVRARLASAGVTDFTEIEAGLEADDVLQGLEDLVSSREGQQEDLIAWSIFLVFLTGADAYVSAHLSRFPTPLDMEATASDGRAELTLRIPFP